MQNRIREQTLLTKITKIITNITKIFYWESYEECEGILLQTFLSQIQSVVIYFLTEDVPVGAT